MLDIVLIRRDPDRVRRSLRRRGLDPSPVGELLRFDEEYRSALTAVERAKAEKNRLSATIAQAADRAAAARDLRPQLNEISARIAELEETARSLSIADPSSPPRVLLDNMPNLLDDSVPDGADESANVEVRRCGEPRRFDFAPKPHWELGEALGILDFARAAKLSGSRFSVLSGAGARLARALVTFFMERAIQRGYLEIAPPLLVSRQTMWSTGQLSKFRTRCFSIPAQISS